MTQIKFTIIKEISCLIHKWNMCHKIIQIWNYKTQDHATKASYLNPSDCRRSSRIWDILNNSRADVLSTTNHSHPRSLVRSFVRSFGSDLRYFPPPDAFACILHSLRQTPSCSIGSYSQTYTRQHGREKCVYARMPRWERRAQITKRTGAMHHGVRYWWLSPAIDVRASGCTHATCISMASGRRVHATGARIPDYLSPRAKEGTILSRDGCSIRQATRISRATRPRRRDAIVDPRRPRNDTTQCAPAYIRVDVVCRVAFTPRETTGLRRSIPFEKASTWEWSVADWCGLWLTWLGEFMWMFFKFIASKINYDSKKILKLKTRFYKLKYKHLINLWRNKITEKKFTFII